MNIDDYRTAEAAVSAHLDACPVCPAGGCAAGVELLRVESATWDAFERADPSGAAEYPRGRPATLTTWSTAEAHALA